MIFRKLLKKEINLVNALNNVGVRNWELEFFNDKKQPSYLFACLDEDRFIGCEGYVSFSLIRDGVKMLTHRSERTFVDPNYRGKGIFENLIECCDKLAVKDNSLFCWGATGALRPFSRAGFDTYTGFRNYIFFPVKVNIIKKIFSWDKIKLFNPLAICKAYMNSNLKELQSVLSFSLFKPIKEKSEVDVKLIDFNYDEIFELISNQNDGNFMINPSNDLFDWLEKKNIPLKKFNLKSGNSVIGYIIFKMNKNQNFCKVVDVFFNSTQVTLVDILIASSANTDIIDYDSIFLALNSTNKTHEKWINSLDNHGIINLKKAGSFVIKPFKNKISINELLLTDLWLEL